MSLAYLLLGHKNAPQIERLFRSLYHPDDLFVLHFDRRASPDLHALARSLAQTFPNVHVLRPRAILWSGFRMAEIQMAAMRVAHAHRTHSWHHFINLTGQDFPLKSRSEMLERLSAQPDASYVSWFDPKEKLLWENADERLNRFYLEWAWLQKLIFLPGVGRRVRRFTGWQVRPFVPLYKRPIPTFFKYYGGSNHLILSREAVRYLLESPAAQRIVRWLSHSLHANEIVFQSVFLNSPLAPKIVNEHLREVEFVSPADPHPRTWRAEDFDRLIASPSFFARKFDPKVDNEIIEKLEAHLVSSAPRATYSQG